MKVVKEDHPTESSATRWVMALDKYETIHGKPFRHEDCYRILEESTYDFNLYD
ncbi:hypothetical protein MKX01_022302 [Papaver californicum]|nr:hypothetical protein MKX01_022302 [Papaver californicum]